MSWRNRVAARVLDAVVRRVRQYPADKLDEVADKPVVWGYTILDEQTGDPYLTRVLFPRLPAWVPVVGGARPVLHQFHRADVDRELHNHPWAWAASVVLCGEYLEERVDHDATALAGDGRPRTEHCRVRWWNWLTEHDWHRVTALRGRVFTLFVLGPRLDREPAWEFMDDQGQRTPWKLFLDLKRLDRLSGAELYALHDRLGGSASMMRLAYKWDDATLRGAIERRIQTLVQNHRRKLTSE